MSFIKIDTEGYDKEIIKSISDLMSKYRPTIVAESFGKSSNDAKMELYEVISKHQYDIYYFGDFDTSSEEKLLTDKSEMTQWENTINIYGIPR